MDIRGVFNSWETLDDGRITDSQGRTVDFKNTILIMTSNIGSPYLLDGIDENGEIKPEASAQVMTEAAKDQVIENGYDPVYGARPLKRYLQKYVETLAARKILSGDVHAGDTLVLDVQNGEFIVTVKDGN